MILKFNTLKIKKAYNEPVKGIACNLLLKILSPEIVVPSSGSSS